MTLESDQVSGSHPVPDVQLQRSGGGTVNPADFVGHELVVLFPPEEGRIAARELKDYGSRLAELDKIDAWLLAICDESELQPTNGLVIVHDVNGSAWQAMTECAGAQAILSRDQGAAFVFGRGGSLQKAFAGPGHAAEVLEELRKRR